MEKRIQAKQITDEAFLAEIDFFRKTYNRWTHVWELAEKLGMPDKVVRAKAKSMIRRKVITGCACGCRGDFERENS